jgi:hypothetical protein
MYGSESCYGVLHVVLGLPKPLLYHIIIIIIIIIISHQGFHSPTTFLETLVHPTNQASNFRLWDFTY